MSYVHVPPLDKYKRSDCLVPLCYTQGNNNTQVPFENIHFISKAPQEMPNGTFDDISLAATNTARVTRAEEKQNFFGTAVVSRLKKVAIDKMRVWHPTKRSCPCTE